MYHIKVEPQVTPVVHPPRKVPLALKEKVKAELGRIEKEGIIVKQTEPAPWVNSMVTVIKPSGKLRICMDPKDLNVAIQREHFPVKTVEDVIVVIQSSMPPQDSGNSDATRKVANFVHLTPRSVDIVSQDFRLELSPRRKCISALSLK